MDTKLSKLKTLAAAGDWHGAIRMAARFPRLGEERGAILDAQMALTNPRFCLGIKKDPATLITKGIEALQKKYAI